MAFAVSGGSLRSTAKAPKPGGYSLQLAPDLAFTYAQIWRKQPEVRTVVDFLARNISQLSLHTFRRLGETDRERLRDHPLAQLLANPNPETTPYRLMRSLVSDRGIFDCAYWAKLGDGGLQRLRPQMVKPVGEDWMTISHFEVKGDRGKIEIPREQVVYFRGYNPDDDLTGVSPIESIRQILSESYQASRMREQVLRNGARISGYLERPANSAAWSDAARSRFREGWRSQYAGHTALEAGGTPILEDGMTFKAAAQNAVDLQYVEARMLTREEVAAAFHIPPPMVGILDKATFSNIQEQHKMLYQDTLGPWLQEIQQDIALQLLPDFDDTENVYVEFNLQEKLRGSFDEQAAQLQSSVGAPYLTRNEARARANLPRVDGGDDLVVPLNVLVGGQASPTDSGTQNLRAAPRHGAKSARRSVKSSDVETTPHVRAAAQVLAKFFARQRDVVMSRLGAKAAAEWWDEDRWNDELTVDLFKLAATTATELGREQAKALGFEPGDYDEDRTLAFLQSVAKSRAEAINSATLAQLEETLGGDEPDPGHVFDQAIENRTDTGSTALVTALAGFAVMEAGKQLVGSRAEKTWLVTSGNPRPEHALMDGETVPIEDNFSNGAKWPGDPVLGADGVAGCSCEVEVTY